MDDLSLMRRLAQLMGWTIYITEQDGRYEQWQRTVAQEGGANSCFVDLDSIVWIYDDLDKHLPAYERQWRPLVSMDDAKHIIDRLVSQGWEYILGSCPDGHYAQLSNYERRVGRPWPEWYSEVASSLERAIALAALRTQEVSCA